MSERLQNLLADLENPDLYVKVPDVPIFDAHVEEWDEKVKGADGKPKTVKKRRVFDKKALAYIAARCNQRDATGNLAPITRGHTIPGKRDESEQPPHLGLAHGYRVRWDDMLGKWVIATNYYFRKDKYDEAKTYPRTSIELYPYSWEIDPIAVIRRTPDRDLGQWTYRRQAKALRYSRRDPQDGRVRPVIRYALEEANMADMPETIPAGEAPAGPSHDEKLMQFAKHVAAHPYAKELAAHYAADAMGKEPMDEELLPDDPTGPVGSEEEDEPAEQYSAAPSATNGCLPGSKDEPARMQRDSEAIRYGRLEKRMQALEKSLAAKDEEVRRYQKQARREGFERQLIQLEAEGVELDRAEELDTLDTLTDAQAGKHLVKIASRYARSPVAVGQSLVPVEPAAPASRDEQAGSRKALQYQRQHRCSWAEACKAVGHDGAGEING